MTVEDLIEELKRMPDQRQRMVVETKNRKGETRHFNVERVVPEHTENWGATIKLEQST